MPDSFDYNAKLRRLVDLRFDAIMQGEEPGPEAMDLEQEIYRHVRQGAVTSAQNKEMPAIAPAGVPRPRQAPTQRSADAARPQPKRYRASGACVPTKPNRRSDP